jgi:hypothetical protein
MKIFPETFEGIKRYYCAFQGKGEFVPILAQINEHVVKLCGGDIREYVTV